MSLILVYKRRGITKDITISGSDGVITPGVNDKIRVRIGRTGTLDSSPLLSISSDAPTANGSSFTKGTPTATKNRLRLDASDLTDIPAGTYTAAFDYFDNADAQEYKNISRQVFHLADT